MSQTGRKVTVLRLLITLAAGLASNAALARTSHRLVAHHGRRAGHISTSGMHATHAGFHRYSRFYGGHVIQCVAFAKEDAGIIISGNARDWWYNAAGVYERGHAPEAGSVLSFSATGRMPLGHVAVVSDVVDSRTIAIDQSHWGRAGISRDMVVKDVSENNDWTAVRVQLARDGAFGSIYPTHGFIYARSDSGHVVPAVAYEPAPKLDVVPGNLRRHRAIGLEVAEVPETHRGLDLSLNGIASDAPDRGLQ